MIYQWSHNEYLLLKKLATKLTSNGLLFCAKEWVIQSPKNQGTSKTGARAMQSSNSPTQLYSHYNE